MYRFGFSYSTDTKPPLDLNPSISLNYGWSSNLRTTPTAIRKTVLSL